MKKQSNKVPDMPKPPPPPPPPIRKISEDVGGKHSAVKQYKLFDKGGLVPKRSDPQVTQLRMDLWIQIAVAATGAGREHTNDTPDWIANSVLDAFDKKFGLSSDK